MSSIKVEVYAEEEEQGKENKYISRYSIFIDYYYISIIYHHYYHIMNEKKKRKKQNYSINLITYLCLCIT